MQNLKDIKKRIASIKSTKKITSAMKMMAVSKLKDVQEAAITSRLYNSSLKDISLQISLKDWKKEYPLFTLRKDIKHITIFVVTPQRGFCGQISEEIAKQVKNFSEMMVSRGIEISILVAGSKGSKHFKKHRINYKKIDIGAEDLLARIKVEGLCLSLIESYLTGETDQIILAYNKFHSVISHEVTLDMFLPIWKKHNAANETNPNIDFIYEPKKEILLDILVKKTLRTQMFQALLEGRAVELASRMISMDKALNNADEMIEKLTKIFHRVRQTSITKELLDIIGGREALSK